MTGQVTYKHQIAIDLFRLEYQFHDIVSLATMALKFEEFEEIGLRFFGNEIVKILPLYAKEKERIEVLREIYHLLATSFWEEVLDISLSDLDDFDKEKLALYIRANNQHRSQKFPNVFEPSDSEVNFNFVLGGIRGFADMWFPYYGDQLGKILLKANQGENSLKVVAEELDAGENLDLWDTYEGKVFEMILLTTEQETKLPNDGEELAIDRVTLFLRVLKKAEIKVDESLAMRFFGIEKEIPRSTLSKSEARANNLSETEALAKVIDTLASPIKTEAAKKEELRGLLRTKRII